MSRIAGDKSETLRGLNGPTAPRKGLPIMADAVFKVETPQRRLLKLN